ncbi:MAG: redox-sensing transcriptional repressor Rex [Ruminococcaceae bacterium]|nr:redox-sensing transcriptional repressor Rex [Oscillospiraceae bacterium]
MPETSAVSCSAIPRPTLERLPRYLNYLRTRRAEGCEQTSSSAIAQDLKLTAIQVRKDLAYVGSGKPRTGHSVSELIDQLESFLGYDDAKDAVLVGAGHLGQALLAYHGFADYGLNILAAFDTDEALAGQRIHGKPIFAADRLIHLTARLGAPLGIITVPAKYAQDVCDQLVSAGVCGILNFAPVHLTVPDNVLVRNVDIAAQMALLSSSLRELHIKRDS